MFAHFDIVDHTGKRVAEGHKASFCLEDRECADGVDPHYDCQNYGDQVTTYSFEICSRLFLGRSNLAQSSQLSYNENKLIGFDPLIIDGQEYAAQLIRS